MVGKEGTGLGDVIHSVQHGVPFRVFAYLMRLVALRGDRTKRIGGIDRSEAVLLLTSYASNNVSGLMFGL